MRPNNAERQRQYYYEVVKKDPNRVAKKNAYERAYKKRIMAELREQLFTIYGNKCACCGESNPLFLTLDHINSDRKQVDELLGLRNTVQRYQEAISCADGTKYQILCYNCNLGRSLNGGICPHKGSEL
jgi:hypothetical protein